MEGEGLSDIRKPRNLNMNDSNASSLYDWNDDGLSGIGRPDLTSSMCSNPGRNGQSPRPNTPQNSAYYTQNRFSPALDMNGEGLSDIRQPRYISTNESNDSSIFNYQYANEEGLAGITMPNLSQSIYSNPEGNYFNTSEIRASSPVRNFTFARPNPMSPGSYMNGEGLLAIRQPMNLSMDDSNDSSIFNYQYANEEGLAGITMPNLSQSVYSNPEGNSFNTSEMRASSPVRNFTRARPNPISPGSYMNGEGLEDIRQPMNLSMDGSNASSIYDWVNAGLAGIDRPEFSDSLYSNSEGNSSGIRESSPVRNTCARQNPISSGSNMNEEGLSDIRQPMNLSMDDSNVSSIYAYDLPTEEGPNRPQNSAYYTSNSSPQRQNMNDSNLNLIAFSPANLMQFSPSGGNSFVGNPLSVLANIQAMSPGSPTAQSDGANISGGMVWWNTRNSSPDQPPISLQNVNMIEPGSSVSAQRITSFQSPGYPGGMDESACFRPSNKMLSTPPGANAYARSPSPRSNRSPTPNSRNVSPSRSPAVYGGGNISMGGTGQGATAVEEQMDESSCFRPSIKIMSTSPGTNEYARSPSPRANRSPTPNSRNVSPSLSPAGYGGGNISMGGTGQGTPAGDLGGIDESACFRPSTIMMSSPPGAYIMERSPLLNPPVGQGVGIVSTGQSPQHVSNAGRSPSPNSRSVSPSRSPANGAGNISLGGSVPGASAFGNAGYPSGEMDDNTCFRPSTKVMSSPPGAFVIGRSPMNTSMGEDAGNVSRGQSPQRSPNVNAPNSRSASPGQMAFSTSGAGNVSMGGSGPDAFQNNAFQNIENQYGGMNDNECMRARPKMAFTPPGVNTYAAGPVNASMNQSINTGDISNGANFNGSLAQNSRNNSPFNDGIGNSLSDQPQNVSQNAGMMGQPNVDLSFLGRNNTFENPANLNGTMNDANWSPGFMAFSPTPLMGFSPKKAAVASGNPKIGSSKGPFSIEDMLSDAGFHDRLRQTVKRQIGDVFTINVVLRDTPDAKCPSCPSEGNST